MSIVSWEIRIRNDCRFAWAYEMFVNLVGGWADLYTDLFEKFATEFINNTIRQRLKRTIFDVLLYFI